MDTGATPHQPRRSLQAAATPPSSRKRSRKRTPQADTAAGSSRTRGWLQRTAPALFIGTLQGLVHPTVLVVFSSTFAGISRNFLDASATASEDFTVLLQVGLALSAIARILSVVALVYYVLNLAAIIFAAYTSFPRAVRSEEQAHLARTTKNLAEVQKELAEAQRDLSQTKAQRERNERLLALTGEQVNAVKSQISEDVRRSSKWPLILGIAGFVVAVAGVIVAFALAP
jgi:hypothetical protein